MAVATASIDQKDLFKPGRCLCELPYLQLGKMRAVNETLLQQAGMLDTMNSRMHGRSNVQTGYRHYLAPQIQAMSDAASEMGFFRSSCSSVNQLVIGLGPIRGAKSYEVTGSFSACDLFL